MTKYTERCMITVHKKTNDVIDGGVLLGQGKKVIDVSANHIDLTSNGDITSLISL